MDIEGMVVLITGGGRGIGAATAKSFAESGARVAIISRTEDEILHVADEVGGLGMVGDVRDSEDCERIAREVIENYGRIDVLINNAGVAVNKPLVETSEKEFDEIVETNLKGVFLMTQAVLRAARPHIIITLSSAAGRNGYPGLSAYCASKFAVRGLMDAFSQETHAKVYTVLPGSVDTQMFRELFDARARVKPEQVADAIVTLCQEEPETGFELELFHTL
jgi:3-oxoacyl-[acyl-carrier protein] reductase